MSSIVLLLGTEAASPQHKEPGLFSQRCVGAKFYPDKQGPVSANYAVWLVFACVSYRYKTMARKGNCCNSHSVLGSFFAM